MNIEKSIIKEILRMKAGLSTLEEIRGNEEARVWLEDVSLGILLSFLRNMTLANTFYQEVYEDVLSADDQWVVYKILPWVRRMSMTLEA